MPDRRSSKLTAIIVGKVVAYVTSGDRLLVFRHVHEPEAGIQVPAGTVEPGESPDDAVIREAHEETGLAGLTIRRYLGSRDYDDPTVRVPPVVHRRYYYHLECGDEAPVVWRHFEEHPSEGPRRRVEFELWWVAFPDGVLPLEGLLGDFLRCVEQ